MGLVPVVPVPVVPVPAVPAPAVPGEALPPLCPGEPLLPGDEDAPLAGAVGLPPGETVGLAPGLGEAVVAGAGLPQFVPELCVVGFALVLALVPAPLLAPVVADAGALDVAAPLALLVGLMLLVGLVLPLDSPGEGLTVALGDGLDALDEADVEGVGLDEASVGVGEAAGDDCGQDAPGAGR